MKKNISQIQESKTLKKEKTDKNITSSSHQKHNTTLKKLNFANDSRKISGKDIIHKSKKKESNLCLTQNIKFNHISKKLQKTKSKPENSFIKIKKDTLNLYKNNVVKKIFSPNKDINRYNAITSKKNSHKDHNNFEVDNEILYMPEYNKINNKSSKNYSSTERKDHKKKILSCNNMHKKIKNENIIDISDNEDDSLIINNDEENEDNNQVINTTFPKLSSNPFLNENEEQLGKNKNNEKKLFFSPSLIRKKGRCIQQAQLYYNNNINVKSPSKTKTILSINSSTTQNSNDTINNLNIYNLDSNKRKKINDLNNNNINIEREIYNERIINNKNNSTNNLNNIFHNNHINNEEEKNNYNLLFKNLFKLIKNFKNENEENIIEILQKIKNISRNNSINFNYQDKDNGNSILHYACQRNNTKIIKYLIEFNNDVNIKNNDKQTALHIAAKNNYLDVCSLLIENGALLNIYDEYKKTPIHYSIQNNNSELIKYFYDIFIETDIDEKICDNLTNNKEINSLFQNYFKKYKNVGENNQKLNKEMKNNQQTHVNNFKKSNKNIMINKQTKLNISDCNSVNKSYDKKRKDGRNKPKLITNVKNSKEAISNHNKTGSYSNLSLNTDNNRIIETDKLINNLDRNKCKGKKIKNKQNKILLKEPNNLSKKILNNPFIQDINKENNKNSPQKSKNKENEYYYDMDKTYEDNNKLKIKKNKFQQNNCLNINKKEENNMNITYDKSRPKINTSSKTINKFSTKIKKQTEYLTENKNNKKNKLLNNNNTKNIIEKKNLNKFYSNEHNISSSKDNILTKAKQLNQTMDANINMNITSINALNKMSLSLNLIKEEEEEKISTKNFICLALLGKGSFGEVYLVQKIINKKNYAMKILRKERIMGQNLSKYAIAERNVLSLSNHPFIVKLNCAFQTLTKLFLILEYCPGGDLAKHLSYEKKFDEKRAKFYLCEILLALEDLHKRNIIFRDLKPENVVLDEEGHCKLTDFGLSKEGIDNDQYTKSFCGSIAYLAPEVLKKQGHGKAVDWYLLGVLLYEMLTGVTPYYDRNKNNLFYNIEQGKLVIPNFVSENAKNLLMGLLQRDPKKRLGGGIKDSEEIKEHKFFEDVDWKKIYEKKIKPPKAMKINNNMYIFNKPKYFADENNLEEIFGDNSLKGWTFINKDDQ